MSNELYIPLDIKLTYRELNLINVLRQTSGYAFYEIESIYRQCGSIDTCIRLMDYAVGCGMSLKDATLQQPILMVPGKDTTDT